MLPTPLLALLLSEKIVLSWDGLRTTVSANNSAENDKAIARMKETTRDRLSVRIETLKGDVGLEVKEVEHSNIPRILRFSRKRSVVAGYCFESQSQRYIPTISDF